MKHPFKIFIVFAILCFSFSLLYFSINSKYQSSSTNVPVTPKITPSTQNITAISGRFDINGVIPPKSNIVIAERKVGEQQFNIVTQSYPSVDGGIWSWNGAEVGSLYELQAYLQQEGNTLFRSETKVVAAPADSEILTINSYSSESTQTKVEQENFATLAFRPSSTPTPVPSIITIGIISGHINLNGYIPTGSTISIMERKVGETNFNAVVSSIPAIDNYAWSWQGAIVNTLYEIKADVISFGNVVAESSVVKVAAPATNELLTINSSVTPPIQTTGAISGIVDINGYIPSSSNVSISIRKAGTNADFASVMTIPPVDGTSWSWNNASIGTKYDILAYLQVNGSNYAQSQLLVVTAPAQNEVLVINSQSLPPQPPANNITYNCNGKDGNNHWQVTLFYNNNGVIKNAKQYTIQLGTSPQDNSLLNLTTTPDNPNQMQSVTSGFVLNEGQTYWTKFAYATCSNCNVFSPFSPDYKLSCTTNPPTNTPAPSNTPVPTNTPKPTHTPTPTPKIAYCNQTCGSNGYQCASGLECIPQPGAIGSDVCRNPNCPDEVECNCGLQ